MATTVQPLFDPLLQPSRDKDGYVLHPDVDRFMVGMDGGEWEDGEEGRVDSDALLEAGWETAFVTFEDQATEEQMQRYEDEQQADVSYWIPTPPEGDGWQLVAVYPLEDECAGAMFVRPKVA